MNHAKIYKTVTKFDKVMPTILWPLFFLGHGVVTVYSYDTCWAKKVD